MNTRKRLISSNVLLLSALFVLTALAPFTALHADVSLPHIFSDHAVLQKSDRVPIWGKADPGERVIVSLGTASARTTTGSDGKWQTTLDLSRSAPGPFELVVRARNILRVADVLVGEVWVASGQSNMEWKVANTTDAKSQIAASSNSLIREFNVKRSASSLPLDDVEGEWKIAGPSTTGRFTAVGYFFVRRLNQQLGQPVGLINSSWGGTKIEGWTSAAGLSGNPALNASAVRYREEEQSFPSRIKKYTSDFNAWASLHQRVDEVELSPVGMFSSESTAPKDTVGSLRWEPIAIPVTPPAVPSTQLPSSGTVWYRRTINVPAAKAGIQQPLQVGRIDGFYTVYFNGEKVGEVTPATGAQGSRSLYLNGALVKEGDNLLVIRIYNPGGVPVICSGASLRFARVPIDGDWQMHVEKTFPDLQPEAHASMPIAPSMPKKVQDIGGYLYNGMISPLIPYALRGVIWYQGESNTSFGWQYREAFPLLITDWRTKWGRGDFPFYFCQLANLGAKEATPSNSALAETREAQSLALKLPHTGQAVLIDLGEADDVHFRNKIDVGDRLARIALANTYGKSIAFSGPVLDFSVVENERIRLTFSHADDGLVAGELSATYRPRSTVDREVPLIRNSPDSQLEGFAICGADHQWVWAQAKIENGNEVVVWSPSIPNPVAVRYAWASNPTCNLYNAGGLPASPFRTDDFPATTRNNRY
jgi:sialate O-acetylesterase